MEVYHKDLSSRLQRLRRDDKYTDVTIIPTNGNKRFRCHRVILAAMSEYFETMFDAGLSETETGEVKLLLDDDLCEAVLTFIYTGSDVTTMENAADILEAANMMQIESLRLTCLNFLQTNLTEGNCVNVMQTAYLHNCKELYENARSLVLKSFDSIAEMEEFEFLQKEQFISILKADNLNCSDERKICSMAFSWIEADFKNRIEYISEILDILVSFPVSVPCMEAKVSHNYDQIRESKIFKTKFKEIQQRGNLKAMLPFTQSHDETMVVIGGSEGGVNQKAMAFSFRQKKWFSLPPLPFDPGYNFAVCSDGMNLYLSGGSADKRALIKYDGQKNEWLRYPDLLIPRQYHSMAVVDQTLYVLGGCENTSDPPISKVHAFFIPSMSWMFKKIDLPTPVRSASIAVQGHNVYLFGGMDESRQACTLAQCMNAKEHYTLRIFYSLPEEVKLQSRAVTLGSDVYIICKTGEIMKFSEKEKAKQVGKVDHFPRKGFGACVFEDKILIVGGEVKLKARKDMLQYNVADSLTVVMQETMPDCLRDFAFTKLTMLQKHLKQECANK